MKAIFKGFVEVDKPAQFITVKMVKGFEMITGYYDLHKQINPDSLEIGEEYEIEVKACGSVVPQ